MISPRLTQTNKSYIRCSHLLIVCEVDRRHELPPAEIVGYASREAVVAHLDDVQVAVSIQGREGPAEVVVGQIQGDQGRTAT